MTVDLRKSLWYGALISATVRHLQNQRAVILEHVDTTGKIHPDTRPNALALEAVDEVLTTVGKFDTYHDEEHDPQSEAIGE